MSHFATLYFKDPKVRAFAVKEAKKRGISFSAYVVALIKKEKERK